MNKPYYLVICRETYSPTCLWQPQWGSYSKSEAQAERVELLRDYADVRVVKVKDDSQKATDDFLAVWNEQIMKR